jgi:AraC-like DNA-binding protein
MAIATNTYKRLRGHGLTMLERHQHTNGYLAVVLSGGYEEAGDRGRFRVQAGDVICHEAFEAHLNRYDAVGADLIVLPAPIAAEFSNPVWTIRDADEIARLAEKDAREAATRVIETMVCTQRSVQDWPHALAEAMRENLHLRLDEWASDHRLADATVSRGFGRVFGISPKAYRAKQRAQMALRLALHADHALSDVAISTGFSDQAHMTRAVHVMTGRTPGAWRSQVNWIQDERYARMAW